MSNITKDEFSVSYGKPLMNVFWAFVWFIFAMIVTSGSMEVAIILLLIAIYFFPIRTIIMLYRVWNNRKIISLIRKFFFEEQEIADLNQVKQHFIRHNLKVSDELLDFLMGELIQEVRVEKVGDNVYRSLTGGPFKNAMMTREIVEEGEIIDLDD